MCSVHSSIVEMGSLNRVGLVELGPVRKVRVDLIEVGGAGLHRGLNWVDDELLIIADLHTTP